MSTIILSLHQNGRGFLRLSKNLYNEKGRPPYPYQSAKSRDLCVAFCTSQGRGAPLVRWPDGHTFFGPVSGRPYFLCFSAYNRPGAGAQYGSGGTPPAPCKNSKKWPKPLFRHAQALPMWDTPSGAYTIFSKLDAMAEALLPMTMHT